MVTTRRPPYLVAWSYGVRNDLDKLDDRLSLYAMETVERLRTDRVRGGALGDTGNAVLDGCRMARFHTPPDAPGGQRFGAVVSRLYRGDDHRGPTLHVVAVEQAADAKDLADPAWLRSTVAPRLGNSQELPVALSSQVNADLERLGSKDVIDAAWKSVHDLRRPGSGRDLYSGEELFIENGADLRGCRQLPFDVPGHTGSSRFSTIYRLPPPAAGSRQQAVQIVAFVPRDAAQALHAVASGRLQTVNRAPRNQVALWPTQGKPPAAGQAGRTTGAHTASPSRPTHKSGIDR